MSAPALTMPLAALIRPPDPLAAEGGGWHARRSRAGRARLHEGIDLVCYPGTLIVAPYSGKVIRIADPYKDERDDYLLGLLMKLDHDGLFCKMLYVDPRKDLIGKRVVAGQVIAVAQDLRRLYPRIIPHCHVELYRRWPVRIDPTPFFFGREVPSRG